MKIKRPAAQAIEPILCLIITFLLLNLIFGFAGLGFFGEKSIAISDMATQYSAFFEAYRRGEFLFSWNAALGIGMSGTFAYYLSSPFTLLFLLLPGLSCETVAFLLLGLKLGLGACAMDILLRARFSSLDARLRVGLSLCYGLMSYVFFYFINLFWFDAFIWLPLAALGTEKLIQRKNSVLLFLSLVLLFWSNFYISYIVGLFLLLYMIFRAVACGQKFSRVIGAVLRLAGHAVAAAAICAPLLVPMALDYLKSIGLESYNGYGVFNFTAKQFACKLFCGSFDSIGNACAPTIFCSVLVFLLAGLWFINRRIGVRTRIAGGLLILFMLVSFLLPALDIVWHGFAYPNAFAYRYAFCFCFLLILLAAESLTVLGADAFVNRKLTAVLLFCPAALYGVLSLFLKDELPFGPVAATIGAALIYGLLVLLLLYRPRRTRLVSVGLTLLLALELFANGVWILDGVDRQNVFPLKSEQADLNQQYASLISRLPDGYYRVEDLTDVNGGLRRGFMNLSLFSSSYDPALQGFYRNIGYGGNFKSVSYQSGSPLADDLLGLRFVISDSISDGYTPYAALRDRAIYENADALPLGFMADSDASEFVFPAADDPAQNTRALLEALCATASGTTRLADAELLDSLRSQPLVIHEIWSRGLNGDITAAQDGLLFLSIPYSSSWDVKVDGRTVQPVKIAGALTGIPLESGSHRIELCYQPNGLKAGCLISATALLALVLSGIVHRRQRKRAL